jgi:membrane protein DedA with SNARE-associated domain
MPYIHLFSSLFPQIETYISHGGYFLLFIFMVIEGIPLIGMVVPGHIVIIIGGFLAKIGTLNLLGVIIASTIGALIGDYIGFYLGKKIWHEFYQSITPILFHHR